MEQEPQQQIVVTPDVSGLQLTVSYWSRDVDIYQVFGHEFKSIKSAASQSGLYLGFFGISFGVMVSLLLVLATVTLTSPVAHAVFIIGSGVSVILTALLGIKARIEYKATHDQIDYIEKQSRNRSTLTPPLPKT